MGSFRTCCASLIPAWADREDSEHEQAIVRLIVGGAASVYLLFIMLTGGGSFFAKARDRGLYRLFFCGGFGHHSLDFGGSGGESHSDGFIGCVLDNSAATGALFINGGVGYAAVRRLPVGHIRQRIPLSDDGTCYLSMALGICGFCSVLLLSDEWSADTSVSIGLLTGLVLLPLYVASLLKNLEIALGQGRGRQPGEIQFPGDHESRDSHPTQWIDRGARSTRYDSLASRHSSTTWI